MGGGQFRQLGVRGGGQGGWVRVVMSLSPGPLQHRHAAARSRADRSSPPGQRGAQWRGGCGPGAEAGVGREWGLQAQEVEVELEAEAEAVVVLGPRSVLLPSVGREKVSEC